MIFRNPFIYLFKLATHDWRLVINWPVVKCWLPLPPIEMQLILSKICSFCERESIWRELLGTALKIKLVSNAIGIRLYQFPSTIVIFCCKTIYSSYFTFIVLEAHLLETFNEASSFGRKIPAKGEVKIVSFTTTLFIFFSPLFGAN